MFRFTFRKHRTQILIYGIASIALFACRAECQVLAVTTDSYQQALKAAQTTGFVVTPQALSQSMPRTDRNAASIYARISALLTGHPLSDSDKAIEKSCNTPYPTPAQITRIRTLLAHHADILKLTHQAAKLPECVFSRNWGIANPGEVPFPELTGIRQAVRLLSFESLVMAHEGRGLAAVQNEADGFRLARHGGSDCLLISILLQVACDSITFHGMQNIMVSTHGNAAVAKAIRETINANWHEPLFEQAFRRETAIQIGIVEYSRSIGLSGVERKQQVSSEDKQLWDTSMMANGIYLLEQMRKLAAAAELPYPTMRAREDEITDEIKRENPPDEEDDISLSLDMIRNAPLTANHTFGYLLVPEGIQTLSTKPSDLAMAGVTNAAASIFEYKAAHGEFPETLAGMKMPPSTDPYDLKPLRYRREGKGFVVYSIGATMKYDGGKPGQKLPSKEAVFRYEP